MTKTPFSLKLDETVMERVRKRSKIEHRPVNNFIEAVLLEYLDRKEKEETKKPGE